MQSISTTVIRLNIDRFKSLLETELDESIRAKISGLLAEEELKLAMIPPDPEHHIAPIVST